MRYLIYGILVAIAFLAGWQVEHRARLWRIATTYTSSPHTCSSDWAIDHGGARFGDLVDLQICDANGHWRTLAFGATVDSPSNSISVREKDRLVLTNIEQNQPVRLRPTLHPGRTYVCEACARCEPHDGLLSIYEDDSEYECRICRGRLILFSDPIEMYFNDQGSSFFPRTPRASLEWLTVEVE